MCRDCFVTRIGKAPRQIDCCGDLADEFGLVLEDLPLHSNERRAPLERNECLCWIDFHALGEKFGFRVDEPTFNPKAGLNFDAWVLTERAKDARAG